MKLPNGFEKVESKKELDFLFAKVPTRSHDIPVIGCYKIIRMKTIEHKNPLYREMLIANWKQNIDDEYGTEEFAFRASPLFNKASIGPFVYSPDLIERKESAARLVGKDVIIIDITLKPMQYDGVTYDAYSIKWQLT